MTVKIIACEVMRDEILAVTEGKPVKFEFISMGLHLYPQKLGQELQRILNSLSGYERVILAFGLCGGATKELKTADFTLTIPRVHDCIPLLLGSVKRYESFRQQEKGTLYLSHGWMNGERSILSDHGRLLEKYGAKKAASLLARIYDGYRRVVFIRTGNPLEEADLERSRYIGGLLRLEHQIAEGDLSYIKSMVHGPWPETDFIHIPPGGRIDEWYFYDSPCDPCLQAASASKRVEEI